MHTAVYNWHKDQIEALGSHKIQWWHCLIYWTPTIIFIKVMLRRGENATVCENTFTHIVWLVGPWIVHNYIGISVGIKWGQPYIQHYNKLVKNYSILPLLVLRTSALEVPSPNGGGLALIMMVEELIPIYWQINWSMWSFIFIGLRIFCILFVIFV